MGIRGTIPKDPQLVIQKKILTRYKIQLYMYVTERLIFRAMHRVFDETLYRILVKHETRENAPVFRETFASFARSNL